MSEDDIGVKVNIGQIVSGEVFSEETLEELEVTNCSLSDKIPLDDPKILGSLVPLGLICLIVTFGNILVISAVKISSKLRGPTNTIIVSLAVADLLLGVLVLPLSAVYEVVDSWVFGRHLCFIWLSVDVWTCTASILHLVAISMDRYIAVTHPVTYPNIMTSTRTKLLIGSVWVISFIICFPPLVGWNEERHVITLAPGEGFDSNASNDDVGDYDGPDDYLDRGSKSIFMNSSIQLSGFVDNGECNPQCILPSDPGYVLYSAIGSFFAPMLVMIFFNWRIYRVASKTTKAIRRGFTKVKSEGGSAGSMGIHRGKSMVKKRQTSEIALSEREVSKDHSDRKDIKQKQGLYDFPSARNSLETYRDRDSLIKNSASSVNLNGETQLCTRLMTNGTYSNGTISKDINGVSKSNFSCAQHGHRRYFTEQGTQTVKTFKSKRIRRKSFVGEVGTNSFKREKPARRFSLRFKKKSVNKVVSEPPSPTNSLLDDDPNFRKSETSFTKRNIKSQVRKFRMETKAAKTIGIIVGCFVLCWLPFFTIYITRAACVDCVPDLLFSVFFWLGYCNSAINPVIYGLFSREFRAAFKRILCKFFCKAGK